MTTEKNIDAVFKAVRSGSVGEFKKILAEHGSEETTRIVNSFNNEGETPLIVAIKENHPGWFAYWFENWKLILTGKDWIIWRPLHYS